MKYMELGNKHWKFGIELSSLSVAASKISVVEVDDEVGRVLLSVADGE